jgi:hypothetical protein
MSAPKKLRGGGNSELTRFKFMWRDTLAEPARDFWRSRFLSADTQAQVRKEIFTKLKINLSYDNQLAVFRDWDFEQQTRDLEAERMRSDEQRFTEEHGDLNKDQVRDLVLKRSYERAMAIGNFKQGLATVREDVNVQKVSLDRNKFEMEISKLILTKAVREAAERIASSNLSNADKIAAMRREAFKSVDALQASGRIKIPKA